MTNDAARHGDPMRATGSEPARDANKIDAGRRRLLAATGSGAVLTALGGAGLSFSGASAAAEGRPLRWGIVGTGMIANAMAPMIAQADGAALGAVSSRKLATAKEFADKHDIGRAFDSWQEMCASPDVDAIYVATPTFVREEISIAAARNGKHVLGEKPFASLPSLQRITQACRDNGVGFMDGTHFVHAPRTRHIREHIDEQAGWPWSLDSSFQFNLPDRDNIRYNPELEPMGAIGDAGWYNMRAVTAYLSPDLKLVSAEAFLRRDKQSNAVISGSGVLLFDDDSTSTWNCGFDSGAVVMDIRLSGARGSILLDDFVGGSGDDDSYTLRRGSPGPSGSREQVVVSRSSPAAALMFEDFWKMVRDPALQEQSMAASERTQALLDASWEAAIRNETRASK